ncbi:MAG: TraR/DksA family transcriptional regulator [Myxococcota bacterium]
MARENTHLTDEQLRDLRERLMATRRQMLDELRTLAEERDVTRSSHEVGDDEDAASEQTLLELQYLMSHHDQQLLEEVEAALERMDEGTYGVCEESGELIPYRRLKAVPTARYTVDVQQRHETDERTARQRALDEEDRQYSRYSSIAEAEQHNLDIETQPPPATDEDLRETSG